MQVTGVDGCPGGWLAITYDDASGTLTPRIYSTFGDLLTDTAPSACVAVDIPIGLAEGEARICDVQARAVLGPRRSSVFSAPDPRLVDAPDYHEASARSRVLLGKGISRQAFAIYPKIAEVNGLVTPALQSRVIEVHPEVSFWALRGGKPMQHAKKTPEGFAERRDLLLQSLPGVSVPERREARRIAPPAGADDVLDAIVAVWTARRFAQGRSGRLPPQAPLDARGLRVEINY